MALRLYNMPNDIYIFIYRYIYPAVMNCTRESIQMDANKSPLIFQREREEREEYISSKKTI